MHPWILKTTKKHEINSWTNYLTYSLKNRELNGKLLWKKLTYEHIQPVTHWPLSFPPWLLEVWFEYNRKTKSINRYHIDLHPFFKLIMKSTPELTTQPPPPRTKKLNGRIFRQSQHRSNHIKQPCHFRWLNPKLTQLIKLLPSLSDWRINRKVWRKNSTKNIRKWKTKLNKNTDTPISLNI